MPSAATDETLMGRVVRGDEQALEILIRRHASALLSYITRTYALRGGAEDIFQEVWISVWVKRRSFDATRRFKPWLYRIAKNRAVSMMRRRSFNDPAQWSALAQDSPVRTAGPDLDGNGAAASSLEMDEALVAAGFAINRLPESQRDVVCLRLYAGLNYAEIAAVMSVSESTIRSNMCHALRKLRISLAAWVDVPPPEESRDDRSSPRRQHARPR